MEQDQVIERLHALEVAQAIQAATQVGSVATLTAAQTGAAATTAAAQAGTISTTAAAQAGTGGDDGRGQRGPHRGHLPGARYQQGAEALTQTLSQRRSAASRCATHCPRCSAAPGASCCPRLLPARAELGM